ncbi:MAG TPA: L-ribulose-5-phosphate 4-epimerase [Bacteroidales bacterium]|nr:L-ribulose-5-phosphate 4-epimerase [Bacteroidales bacterium]
MFEKLKEEVFKANLDLVTHGLVIHTWGNASGRDPSTGMIVIKPSGVSYEYMKPGDMVVLYPDGRVAEGNYKPSTDAPTHLFLYNKWKNIGGVAHTHSSYATSWAQAGRAIPPFGTTHADHFSGDVPCTRVLKASEIKKDYELNTGKVIVETMDKFNHLAVPSVLVANHGPFSWGKDAADAVYNAVALEEIAMMAFNTILLGRSNPVSKALIDKHFTRKHGEDAYYGQTKK